MNTDKLLMKVSEIVANDNANLTVNIRVGRYNEFDKKEASKLKAYLEANEISFKDTHLAGEMWTIQFAQDGVEVSFWYKSIKTDEERLEELKSQVRELSEKMGVELQTIGDSIQNMGANEGWQN